MKKQIEKIQETIKGLNKELQTQMNNLQLSRTNVDMINGAIQAYSATIKLLEESEAEKVSETLSGVVSE